LNTDKQNGNRRRTRKQPSGKAEPDNLASANVAANHWRLMRMTVIVVSVAMIVAVMMVRITIAPPQHPKHADR